MSALGSLVVRIVGDSTQFNKEIAAMQKQLNASTKGLMTIGRNMTTVGDSMTKGVTLPILAVGAGLLKLGEDFDAAYDKIRVGTGKTGKELEELNNDFRAIAKAAPSSFNNISAALTGYSQKLGLAGKPLQTLSTQILNLSRLTKTDLNANISQSAKLFNNWKIATEDQSKTLDLMFRASQHTGIGVDKLMASVTDTGPILRSMGFDLETTIALVAQFDKEGIDMSAVAMGMKKALVEMAKQGITDPQQALAIYVERIKNAGNSIEAAGIAAELFGARGGPAMAAAIREGRLNLDDLVVSLKTGTDSINAASAATMDWQEKLLLLRNNAGLALEPLASKVFESLGRAIEGVTPKIAEITKELGDMSPVMQDNLLKWGLILAIIPPVISVLGRAATGAIQFRNALLLMNAAANSSILLKAAGLTTGALASAVVIVGSAANRLGNLTKAFADNTIAAMSWNDRILEILNVSLLGIPEILDAMTFKLAGAGHEFKFGYGAMIKAIFEGKPVVEAATISTEGQAKALIDAVGAVTAYQTAQHQGIEATIESKIAAQDHENAIAALAAQYPKLAEAELEEKLAMDEGTGATDDAAIAADKLAKAKEDLKTATDELYSSLFDEYLLNADISSGLKAADDAYAEYIKAVKDHGIKSDDASQKEEDWVRVIDGLTQNQIPELINKTGLLTAEEAVHLQGMQDQIDKAKELGIITPQEWQKISDSITQKISGSILPGFLQMQQKANELAGIKIEPKIGLDTSEFYSKLSQSRKDYYDAKGWSFASGGIAGYAKGGIAGSILSASKGMITPSYDNGGILTMLHKNEVVLNAGQTRNLAEFIFGLANNKSKTFDSEANSPTYVINIAEMSVREEADIKRIANELSTMKQDKLTGMGIKNV